MPEWLLPHFDGALGADADGVMQTLKTRAGFTRECAYESMEMIDVLARDGVTAVLSATLKCACMH
jgi:uncharacterized protein Smg (DUF494 family)